MFFFPLSDENPTKKKPLCNWIILFFCIIIYVYQQNLDYHQEQKLILSFGMIPSVIFKIKELPDELIKIPSYMSLVSSMFLHGGWMHLIGNMAYLYIFGDNIEDVMGKVRFLIFYSLCGIFAALAQAFVNIHSDIPMIGASGAVSGILGAYLILYPQKKIRVFFWFIIFFKTFKIPAMFVIGGWILIQFFSLNNSENSNVAYAAHIGGFIAGLALINIFKISTVKINKLTKGSLPKSKYD